MSPVGCALPSLSAVATCCDISTGGAQKIDTFALSEFRSRQLKNIAFSMLKAAACRLLVVTMCLFFEPNPPRFFNIENAIKFN